MFWLNNLMKLQYGVADKWDINNRSYSKKSSLQRFNFQNYLTSEDKI